MENEKKEGEKAQEEIKREDVVTLTKEQYASLLDRISELEDLAQESKKSVYSLDELAEEGRKVSRSVEVEEFDWENLSQKELVEKIMDLVNRAGTGLKTEIETLKVLREIDKCEAKYEDFWKYEEDIRRIAMENPSLSIEKAYKLAKLEKEGSKKGEEDKSVARTKTEKLLNLPPRGFPGGEKPGVAPGSTKSTEVRTLRDAALRAWEEVVGKGKQEI